MYVKGGLCLLRPTAFALAIVSHQKPCRSVVEGYEFIQLHWLHDISIDTLIHSCFILTINTFLKCEWNNMSVFPGEVDGGCCCFGFFLMSDGYICCAHVMQLGHTWFYLCDRNPRSLR